jgi:hypothetical protein
MLSGRHNPKKDFFKTNGIGKKDAVDQGHVVS